MEPDVISSEYSPKVGIMADPLNPAMVHPAVPATTARVSQRIGRRPDGPWGGFESRAKYPRRAVPQAAQSVAARRTLDGMSGMAATAVPMAARAPAHEVRLVAMAGM
jgi:hypothetical protein